MPFTQCSPEALKVLADERQQREENLNGTKACSNPVLGSLCISWPLPLLGLTGFPDKFWNEVASLLFKPKDSQVGQCQFETHTACSVQLETLWIW